MICAQFTKAASFITPTVGGNICPFAIPSGWPSRGWSPRLTDDVILKPDLVAALERKDLAGLVR